MARLVCDGGLNENSNADVNECFSGYNFELSTKTTRFQPRAPIDLKGTTSPAGSISGIMQLVTRSNVETTLIFSDDGATPTIYQWDGTTFTSKRTDSIGVASKLRGEHWPLDDYLIITDLSKTTPLLKWNGTTVSRVLTGISSGSNAVAITSSGGTATVTETSHGRVTGDIVKISGATQTEYNVEKEIIKTGANTYTYTISGAPASPATGSPVAATGTPLYAKYAVTHDGRTWLFNVKAGSTDSPHMMVASAFENSASYTTATRAKNGTILPDAAFYMLSPDLKPINGAFLHQEQLVISTTNGRLFKLLGTDAENYEWVDYYAGSAAIGTETCANIGNDAIYMREGGNIESVSATQTSSDVRTDDISRWIQDTVKDLTDAMVVYDRTNQKVFFFTGNKVLVLFKDILYSGSGKSPWSVYTTNLATGSDNAFAAVSAKYMLRPGTSTRSVYFGDANGHIYDINGTGVSGDGGTEAIEYSRTTKVMDIEVGTLVGNVRFRRVGQCSLTLNFDWADEYNISKSIIPLSGPALETGAYFGGNVYFGGEVYFNQGFEYTRKVSTRGFSPAGMGEAVQIEVYLNTNVRFEIDHIEI